MLAFPDSTLRASWCWSKAIFERIVFPALRKRRLSCRPVICGRCSAGGPHVQHFWRLLKDHQFRSPRCLILTCPQAEGYGEIKTAIGHLIEQGVLEKTCSDAKRGGHSKRRRFLKQCTPGQPTSTYLVIRFA